MFLLLATRVWAGPEPVQYFYLPLPEASVQRTLVEMQPNRTIGQTIRSVTSLTTTRDSTIIYYDHWENGYDVDIANPVNIYSASNPGGTQIWGDGDPSNGIPPGFASDIIDADAVIALTNDVVTPRDTSTILYDARDKLASTKAVAMTRAEWATNPGTVLAGAVEVYSTAFLGTSYEFPIGEDLASLSEQMFEYVAVFIMSAEDGNVVEIDLDGDGAVDVTRTLNEGENYFGSGVETGGSITSSGNVQVHLITGNLSTNGGNLEARWYTQLPVDTWSSEYYNPVGSSGSNQPTQIYLYNPNGSAIDIDYETFVGSGTINIAAGEVAEYTMPSSSGAVFTSQGGEKFFGVANVAAGGTNGGSSGVDNDTWDWGFSLVPEEILTPQVVVGWGPGADDRDDNGTPDAQGSPVWVAVTESTVVYVDYDGDASTGANTDPNGNKYDVAYNLSRLQQTKVYDDSDNDQTGMKLYTVDGTLITAAWGQDPSVAGAGNPYLDLGTTVPPFPFPQLIKTAEEIADGDGIYEPGDTVEYTVSVTNLGAVPLADLILSDELPSNVSYVEGTLSVGGVAQADDPSGTPFPLDGEGIVLPTIGIREELLVIFEVTLDPAAAGSLVNTAILDIGPEVLIADSLSSSSAIDVVNNRVSPSIEFTDSGYATVSLYDEGDDIYLELTDPDLNVSQVNADTFTVIVTNSTNGDFELVNLTETGANTGIFRGGPLSTTGGGSVNPQNSVLKINVGDSLSVTATDPGDPVALPNFDTASATVPVPTNEKLLYLRDNTGSNALTRIEPGAAGRPGASLEIETGVKLNGVVTYESFVAGSNMSTGNPTVSLAHEVFSGTDSLMVIAIFGESDNHTGFDISGVSWDSDLAASQTATKLSDQGTTQEAFVEIWFVYNPSVGSGDVDIAVNNSQVNGGAEDSIIVVATTFDNVDLSVFNSGTSTYSAFDTPQTNSGYSTSASISNVPGDPGDLVYAYVSQDDARTITADSGQDNVFGPVKAEGVTGDGSEGEISSKVIGPGESTADFSWTFGGSDAWAVAAFAINSSVPSAVSFTQSPTMSQTFSMPTGGAAGATLYIETTASLGATVDIALDLSVNSTSFFQDSTANVTTISTGATNLYQLDWSGTLDADVTIDPGDAVEFGLVNAAGIAFDILYDSGTYPSAIALPATTVIDVENVDVYDAPYPDGTLVTDGFVGQKFYIRTTISDPFGTSDISNPGIQITDPNSINLLTPDPSDLSSVASLIASDADSLTYEYEWQTPATDGLYTITVSADEGTEGTVSDSLQSTITLAGIDGGTPSQISFTTGNDGADTDTFTSAESIGVRLIDYDENEDSGAIDTVQVTITTSSGDSDVVTLVETGVNTGIFTALFPSATDTTNADDGDINADVGTGLTVTYFDDDDPTDGSQDQAAVPLTTPNTAGVVVDKVLVEPSDGSAIVGDQVVYQITVTNVGNVDLATVELQDAFADAELTFVSASVTPDSNAVSTGTRTLTWDDLGALGVGESTSVTVTYTSAAAGTISSTATANTTSAFNDPSDSDTENLTVTNPGLTITKSLEGGAQTAYYGNLVEFTIDIENTGDTTIETLPFTDNYSSCLQFLAATPAADSSGGGVAQWNDLLAGATTLAPGATTQITLTFLVVGECDPALNVGEARFAIDVNGDAVPPAEDSNEDLTTDAASVSGTVWQDDDGSGSQDGVESGLAGLRVYIDLDGDGVRDSNEPFDITDSDGAYRIGNLAEGTYTVRIDENFLDDALSITTPTLTYFSLTLDPGEDADADFGLELTTVTGIIFNDVDGDGDTTPGVGEDGIGGVDVIITDSLGNVQTIRTLADGSYTAEVATGEVWVNVDESSLPAGYTLTTDLGVDNEPQSLTATSGINTFDGIGYQQPQGVAGHLFIDLDSDGNLDAGEPDLSGVTVFYDVNSDGILDPDGTNDILGDNDDEVSAITDSSGDYVLAIPTTGSVSIKVDTSTLPSGMDSTPTTANDPQSVTVNASATTVAADTGFAFTGLGIVKTSDATGDVEPGDTITYTVLVSNTSGSTHTGIDITDSLPSDVTFVSGSLSINAPLGYENNYTTNITEDFESQDETGGTPIASGGVPGWVGNWFEIDESNGFDVDDIEIANDTGANTPSWALTIENQDNGAGRGVDLSAADSATIDFTYRRVSLNAADDDVDVQISATGSAPWTTLGTYGDGNNDNDFVDQGTPITITSGFFTANTVIRFYSESGILEDNDWVNFDDIVISVDWTEAESQTGSAGNFPTNTELGNDYLLADGQYLTITYKVKVVDDPAGVSITNTASVVSDQQLTPTDSSVTNDIYNPAQGILSGYVLEDTTGDGNGNLGIENVTVELLDSSGNSIDSDTDLPGVQITVTTTDSDGAYSFEGVVPGSYQVKQTQPSGYFSVASADDGGDENILGDVTLIVITDDVTTSGNTFIEQQPATIVGYVYEDYNGDGVGDIGIANVVLELLDSSGNSIDSDSETVGVQATTTTSNISGQFFFTDLVAGTSYIVRQVQPSGYQSVGSSDGGLVNRIGDVTLITVGIGLNTGYYFTEELLPGSISGVVYDDTDGDGTGDVGIDGVRVFIDRNSNGVFDGVDVEVTTAGGGAFSFGNLRPGVYQIVAEDASGYVSVSDSDGGDASITLIALGAGVDETNIDFIDGIPATISGQVRDDTDSDGDTGDADSGISGVTVELYNDANQNGLVDFSEDLVDTAVTDGSGNFSFSVPAGDYVLLETDPANYLSTADTDGANDNQISITAAPNTTYAGNYFLDGNQGPNLSVTKSLDGGAVTLSYGDLATYTISIANDGNTNVLTLPLEDSYNADHIEYVSASILPSSVTRGSIVWDDLGSLNSGESTDLTITFRVIGESNPVANSAIVDDAEDEFANLLDASASDTLLTTQTSSVTGRVWDDADGDQSQGGGESGLSGITVYLDLNENGVFDLNEPTADTDANGDYTFPNLDAGDYDVRVDESTLPGPPAYNATTSVPVEVTLGDNTDQTDVDFGYQQQTALIDVVKTSDAAGDLDPGDTVNYTIVITNNTGSVQENVTITDLLPAGTTYVADSASYTWSGDAGGLEYLDDFSTQSYSNSFGSDTWSGSWTEGGSESGDNPAAGGIQIDGGSYEDLFWTGLGGGDYTLQRPIDLTSMTSATININLQQYNTINGTDTFTIEVSGNNGSTWTEVYQLVGALGTNPSQLAVDIPSALIGANSVIRLTGNGFTGYMSVNEIEIVANSVFTITDDAGDPTTAGQLITAADDIDMNAGDTLTITYAVTVNDFPDVSSINNTASYTSVQQTSPLTSSVFDAVNVGVISGQVLADADGNGVGDVGLAGIVITLRNADGSTIDTDPNTAGVQEPESTTDGLGTFSFENLPLGDYRVVQLNQPVGYISVSDTDGFNNTINNVIGDENALSLASNGDTLTSLIFLEAEYGSISGTVYDDLNLSGDYDSGEPGLANATIDLILDANGNGLIDGVDIVYDFPATSDVNGDYAFASVPVGTYIIRETDPSGYYSTGDDDGANDNAIITGIVVTSGGSITSSTSFFDSSATANSDSDCESDFLELALNGDTSTGVLANGLLRLQLIDASTGRFDVVFSRPNNLLNVSYTLEGTNDLLGTWFTIATIPANSSVSAPFTSIDNGSFETITYGNIQAASGFNSTDFGLVRLAVTTGATTLYTQVYGWQATQMELAEANSWSNPFTMDEVFCGTVDAVAGQILDLGSTANGSDLGALVNGGGYYVEVASGAFEGHRFEIASGDVDEVTLTTDTDIYSPTGGDTFNTANDMPALTGADIKIRRYRTFDELFDKDSTFVGQDSGDPNLATHIYIFNNRRSIPEYEAFMLGYYGPEWAFFGVTEGAYWVREDQLYPFEDQGSLTIDPATGFVIISRQEASKIYAYGKVRNHDSAVVLNDNGGDPTIAGYNLIGALYPVTQVPVDGADDGQNGRGMTSSVFQAGADPDNAAEILLWDTDPEIDGRATVFFLFDDTEDAWIDYAEVGGPPFTNLNDSPNTLQFRSDRASLIKLPEGDETVLIVPEPTP
ncbi:SdrD B-like domain-containing protein [Cerasicoccus maritimus]|uniref:SdrD B-like domain-containing protein n=1 Tax=Cerasicoccus maritimus TaxID=490089 RepID=UPI0028528985|nr:SdrD B-like domain-containing protein [Cerasicoccus maritimus]